MSHGDSFNLGSMLLKKNQRGEGEGKEEEKEVEEVEEKRGSWGKPSRSPSTISILEVSQALFFLPPKMVLYEYLNGAHGVLGIIP